MKLKYTIKELINEYEQDILNLEQVAQRSIGIDTYYQKRIKRLENKKRELQSLFCKNLWEAE